MIFLVDHNLEGHALLLSGNIASLGWLAILPIHFVTFEEVKGSSGSRVISFANQKNRLASAYGNFQSLQTHKLDV